MIIDSTYFRGMLSIGLSPDTGEPSVTQEAERERIEWFIKEYEKEYLKKLLGDEVCTNFVAYCEGVEEDEYFMKLKERLQEDYSPIACYVFYKFVTVGNVHVTNMGSVKSAGEDVVSPRTLCVRVWNDMVDKNRELVDDFFLEPKCELVDYINVFNI